jgi:hypothetical protein
MSAVIRTVNLCTVYLFFDGSKKNQAAEALHLAHLMSAHGYFFPVEDHILTVKNDGTLYRFQVIIFS